MRVMFFLTIVLPLVPLASSVDSATCAVCYKSWQALSEALNATKTELETSKVFNDKKAEKVDKVQKAQTRRWLKNEYGVALRASLEEELELLCTRDSMTSTPNLQQACTHFVEEHEDELPRAILDGKQIDPFCSQVVPGCEGPAVETALSEHNAKAARSEPIPKAKSLKVRSGVTRLVGKTFTKHTQEGSKNAHTIVLVHNGSVAAGSREVKDVRFASLISEFYALATSTNASKDGSGSDRFHFCQIDTSKNDLPTSTPLADRSGISVLFYFLGEMGQEPKSLPGLGEKTLAWADASDVRTKLTQLLLTYLPSRDQGLVKKLMQARETEMAAGASAPGSQADRGDGGSSSSSEARQSTDAGGGGGGGGSSSGTTKPAPRRKRAAASSEARARKRSQLCDVCVLVASTLSEALNDTKAEYERSKEFNDRKAQKVDKVQKAQTKRWLKNEYKVELAASVEDRIETACEKGKLFEELCLRATSAASFTESDGAWAGLGETQSKDMAACTAIGEARCKELLEDHAETLVRATLDDKGVAACAKVLDGCMLRPDLLDAGSVAGSDKQKEEL